MNTPNDPGLLATWQGLVRRRWLTGAVVFVVVLGAALAVVFLTHPIHRAEAKLRIGEPPPMTGVSPTAGILGLWGLGGDAFANDLELLASRTVAEDVVAAAALNAEVRAPRGWHRDSLFVAFEAGRDTRRAAFRAEWLEGDGVRVERAAPSDSVVGVFAPGEPARFGGLTVVFREWRDGMPTRIGIATEPFGEAVRRTRRRIVAERTRREANALDVHFDHTDPAVSELAVRTAVERFVALRTAIQQRESGETTDSLRAVAEATRAELRHAEEAMEAFQRGSRTVDPGAQGESFMERYGQVVSRWTELRHELEATRSLLRRVEGAGDPVGAWAELTAHPHFIENETVGRFLSRLTELEARRRELATRRTEGSQEYRLVTGEIEELDRTLWSLARGYRLGLEEEEARLAELVAGMEEELSLFPSGAIELARHERGVRLLSEVLVVTEQRLRQEELREALTFANVQVVDPPALRDRPVWPRRGLGSAAGLLLAFLFGGLGMVAADRADRTVRRAADVRALVGAPVLATVVPSGNGTATFSPHEISAIRLRLGASSNGRAAVVVASADVRAPTEEVAGGLIQGWGEDGSQAGSSPGALPAPRDNGVRVAVARPLASYAAAAAAVDGNAPVALVAIRGRTRREELRRAAELVAEAGGTVAGAILVCRDRGEAEDVWR